jgi:hypothetical protein
MGNDVVNHAGRSYSPLLLAHDAQGAAHQEGLAGFIPSGVVAALSGWTPLGVVLALSYPSLA